MTSLRYSDAEHFNHMIKEVFVIPELANRVGDRPTRGAQHFDGKE
jgi:hypothetical protein